MSPTMPHDDTRPALSTRIVGLFLQGPLPMLIILGSLLAGMVSLLITPREEEPQIVVPMADVHVSAPGLSAQQVERQIATRLEKLLFQIDGVEYVYSMSQTGGCVVTVRFHVGEDREDSLVKIYNKLHSNLDLVPSPVSSWVVKPIEIDDVPIVIATLWSQEPARYDHFHLRRIAEEVELQLQGVEGTNRVAIVGGQPRQVRVELVPEALAARRTAPLDVAFALGVSSSHDATGAVERADRAILMEAGTLIGDPSELPGLVVNVVDGLPVYLRDVAEIHDGPGEADTLTWIGLGPAASDESLEPVADSPTGLFPAVHIAVAKKKGTNAVSVAGSVTERLMALRDTVIPAGVGIRITRDYGATAQEKVDELVEALAVAVLTVVIFIGLVLGWRAALVIALAIPVCYGATLFVNLLGGYTINRVTLFAMILSLGLLVDDPITDVENIERYFRSAAYPPRAAVLAAVQEVRPALIMSTIAIILSFAPLFFITGMMGPYMAPMALNVPLTVTMSTVVAFCVTPYLSLRALQGRYGSPQPGGEARADVTETLRYRVYDRLLRPLLHRRSLAIAFLGSTAGLFLVASMLPMLRLVPLKMLPFDNKNEFQLVVDMPEGTTLERTDAVNRALAHDLLRVPEVRDVTTYAGVASPIDFNGMVRQYYLRRGQHMGELRINLADKDRREHQSHEIVLRVRPTLERTASRLGANLKVVEVPPGPPVVSTITAEIYGDEDVPYARLERAAELLASRLREEPLVVDVDTSVEAAQDKLVFETDKEKAALSGVATEDIVRSVDLVIGGMPAAVLDVPSEVNPLEVVLRLERSRRADLGTLQTLQVKGRPGIVKVREGAAVRDAPQPLVSLGELGRWRKSQRTSTIYHKNLRRVSYVFAEVAGRPPAEVVLDVQADESSQSAANPEGRRARRLGRRTYLDPGGGLAWSLPASTAAVWKGEGEWKITLDVFRDLGIAFAAANVGIFVVLWLQTGSAAITLILMAAIPLTLIGIMPGFFALNLIGERVIAGLPNPTFFTATAMIGMIALAGIVVRNSLVLVDFVHHALREGNTLDDALVQAGAIRVRPILLTAGTTFLGNIVITLDPVFSGLAWSIIFGIFASTVFTLGVIPVIYHLVYRHRPGHGLPTGAPS